MPPVASWQSTCGRKNPWRVPLNPVILAIDSNQAKNSKNMYQEMKHVKEARFIGFKSIRELWSDHSPIPNEKGVYMILTPATAIPQFLVNGPGGFHKQRDPNIPIADLSGRWVSDCRVVYIGKAGGPNSAVTLRQRLKQYLDFGKGRPAPHYGGRLIWQLDHHPELMVAWKTVLDQEPREEEKKLLREFEAFYGKLPFANINH
jgi:hypothetical protein